MEQEINNIENQNQENENNLDNKFENNNEKVSNDDTKSSCNKNNFCKRIDLLYKTIIFIAIVVLFILHFSNSKDSQDITSNNNIIKLAYINTDTVFNNYSMVSDLKDELKAEKDKLENEVMSRQKSFDQKVKNYQANLQSNSINQVQSQNAEKSLMNERNEIMMLSEKYTQELAYKEMQITKRITDSIVNFTKRFNEKYQADYILGYTYGAGIIVANEKYDISLKILEGLNKEYKK